METELQEAQSLSHPSERQLTQMDIMVEQAMRVEGLSGAERLALIDKIEGVYLRRKKTEAEEAFNTAMNAAQKAMEQIPAESLNPHTRSHYAKYAAVDRVIRPIYTDYGFALSFRQGEGAPPDHIRLICRVSHSKGHVEHPFLDLPVDGKGAQGKDVMTKTHATGSGVSYGKRYLAGMIFNLAFIDDKDDNDGNTVHPKVTDAEKSNLEKMTKDFSEQRKQWLLDLFKVENLADLPRSQYGKAMDKINAARKQDEARAKAEGSKQSRHAVINEEQEASLIAKIDEIGGTCKADFLKANKIERIGDLLASQYKGALAGLEEKRRGMK